VVILQIHFFLAGLYTNHAKTRKTLVLGHFRSQVGASEHTAPSAYFSRYLHHGDETEAPRTNFWCVNLCLPLYTRDLKMMLKPKIVDVISIRFETLLDGVEPTVTRMRAAPSSPSWVKHPVFDRNRWNHFGGPVREDRSVRKSSAPRPTSSVSSRTTLWTERERFTVRAVNTSSCLACARSAAHPTAFPPLISLPRTPHTPRTPAWDARAACRSLPSLALA
jgi:hypothetical protein